MLGFPPHRSDAEHLDFPLNNKTEVDWGLRATFVLLLRLYTQHQLYFQRVKFYSTCWFDVVFFFFLINLMLNSYACRTGSQPLISIFRISVILA